MLTALTYNETFWSERINHFVVLAPISRMSDTKALKIIAASAIEQHLE